MELQSRIKRKCPYPPTDAPSHLNPSPLPFSHPPPQFLPPPRQQLYALTLSRGAIAVPLLSAGEQLPTAVMGEVIPVVFIRPSFTQSSTDEWARTLIQALPICLSSPQHRSIYCLFFFFFFYSGVEEEGRRRECMRGACLRSRHGRWQPSLALACHILFIYLFCLCSCHTNEWWLFQ